MHHCLEYFVGCLDLISGALCVAEMISSADNDGNSGTNQVYARNVFLVILVHNVGFLKELLDIRVSFWRVLMR